MTSIFTKIITREAPGHIIYEDDSCIVILDKFPSLAGQTVVIPKLEIDYVGNLDDDTLSHLMRIAKRVAKALDKTFNSERTCFVIEGFEVPHVHIKLYPVPTTHVPLGQVMTQKGVMADDQILSDYAERIRMNLAIHP